MFSGFGKNVLSLVGGFGRCLMCFCWILVDVCFSGCL